MKYTIKDLADGKCAVKNDGTLEELRKVLRLAFVNDRIMPNGSMEYYYGYPTNSFNRWTGDSDKNNLPAQSVKDFLEEEFEFGELVKAWDTDMNSSSIVHFIAKADGFKFPYICMLKPIFHNSHNASTLSYMHISKLKEKEEKIVELTLDDISNGKGIGVNPKLIRIKIL